MDYNVAAMRRCLYACTVMIAIVLPVYGRQEKSSQSTGHQNHTQNSRKPAPPSTTVNFINQQAPVDDSNGAPNHPESRFSRLFHAENWPNIGLFIAGVIGIIIGVCTLRAINRQADAMERTLIATFRPKLVVRGIKFNPGSIVVAGPPGNIQYIVANSGGSTAHVVDSNLTVDRLPSPLPQIPPYSSDRGILGTFDILAGEYQERTFNLDANQNFRIRSTQIMRAGGGQGLTDIHFFGFVQYRDETGTPRRTGFCRRFDLGSQRFLAVDDPEYEYSD